MATPFVTPPSEDGVNAFASFLQGFGSLIIASLTAAVTTIGAIYVWAMRRVKAEADWTNRIELIEARQKAADAQQEAHDAKTRALESRLEMFQEQIHAFRNSVQAALAEKPNVMAVERMLDRTEKNIKEQIDWLRADIVREREAKK